MPGLALPTTHVLQNYSLNFGSSGLIWVLLESLLIYN